jgi:hypothetical protein
VITIVFRTVLMRPHRRSPRESQPPTLNHNRFNGFNKFQDGHSEVPGSFVFEAKVR